MEEKEIIIPELNNETIESMIYVIRGQKVMLDFELAKIYGYETKRFNENLNKRYDDNFDKRVADIVDKKLNSKWR